MILKSPEIQIDKDDPFKYDELGRKASAEALTEFVLSSDSSLVVSLDAPWGQGKTTFLRMWRQHLINKKIPTIYFNAWESDFSDNAWVCLIGEISAAISELSGTQEKAKKYLEQAKNIGAALLRRSIPVAVKIATAGAIDIDKFTEQAIAGLAETVAKEEIEKYEKSRSSLEAFRENLEKLAECFSSSEPPLPLIFIIDELDRCRPNFAIEVLEKAKHFFNVKNIVFVLGVDKVQLGSSIKAVYGQGLDVDGYLRRFMDFDFLLPPPDRGAFARCLFNKFEFKEYFKKRSTDLDFEVNDVLDLFSNLFDYVGFTLREQERCYSIVANCFRITPSGYKLYPVVLCFLAALKTRFNGVYSEFIGGKIEAFAACEKFLSIPGMAEFFATRLGRRLEAYINCSASYPGEREAVYRYYENMMSGEVRESEKQKIKSALSYVEQEDFDPRSLTYIVEKIELAAHFKS